MIICILFWTWHDGAAVLLFYCFKETPETHQKQFMWRLLFTSATFVYEFPFMKPGSHHKFLLLTTKNKSYLYPAFCQI